MAEVPAAIRATILIPSYDHAAWVVESVESALAQSAPDLEVLVIDDGSTDDSVARLSRLSDPRLVVVTQSNVGLSATLNRGLARARGRWVKFLPSDDVLEPGCMARQLAAADAEPGARLVLALPTVVDGSGAALADPAPQAWFDDPPDGRDALLRALLERNLLCAPGALFDRDLARVVGGFDEELRIAQDYDLWLKMLSWAPAALVRERLVRVRWHGANQSAAVTASSEAERARVVLGALERLGLERWLALFAVGGDRGPSDDPRAALAAALERSGLREVAPVVARLRAGAGDGPGTGGVRRRIASVVGRVLERRRAVPAASTPAPIAGGPRREHWLLLAPRTGGGPRSAGLAAALARSGATVTLAADGAPALAEVQSVPFDLARLRALPRARDQRLRVVVHEPDAAAIAFVREARLAGARIVYDRAEGPLAVTRGAIDSERALVDAADDLVGASRPAVKQLALGRRIVHLLPDADGDALAERAHALRTIVARPTVVVAVSCGQAHDAAEVAGCLAALESARGAVPYRIAVIDDGVAGDVLDDLARRDEAGELQLVRNALRGRASGHDLALRATASELLVLLDATRRVPGPGWLDGAVRVLLDDAACGAIVERGRGASSGWAWLAPRVVLQRLAGFDAAYDPASFEDADLALQLAAASYRVAEWVASGPVPVPTLRHGEGAVAPPSRATQHFARKWPSARAWWSPVERTDMV